MSAIPKLALSRLTFVYCELKFSEEDKLAKAVLDVLKNVGSESSVLSLAPKGTVTTHDEKKQSFECALRYLAGACVECERQGNIVMVQVCKSLGKKFCGRKKFKMVLDTARELPDIAIDSSDGTRGKLSP
ncbi:hypothetical protein JX266_012273 [Neoarthrinium moseri]|nr:hypothetical protein JX266_012273 [Neoarthrinium moseri]